MTELSALTIDTPDLTVRVNAEGTKVVMVLIGTADSRAMSALDALVTSVHEAALERAVDEVIVDLRELGFMNSSCFKSFVKWLGSLQEVDAARQYKISLLSNDKHHWQKRSLAALRCFAVDLVRIQTDA
jgi:anti-anti-sigma regulatory factor